MKALRELQGKANAKRARGELGDDMNNLTTYDIQVQCCLCKRSRKGVKSRGPEEDECAARHRHI